MFSHDVNSHKTVKIPAWLHFRTEQPVFTVCESSLTLSKVKSVTGARPMVRTLVHHDDVTYADKYTGT